MKSLLKHVSHLLHGRLLLFGQRTDLLLLQESVQVISSVSELVIDVVVGLKVDVVIVELL